jgi:proline dehydrogenase
MFRSFFIYLSRAGWARNLVTNWAVAWRAASRFVAGEKLEEAIRVIGELNARGINATLDHLGENTTNEAEACRATDDIIRTIDAIQSSDVRANISIKLTQIGLTLGEPVCVGNLRRILSYAAERDNFVRIDMEDFTCVDRTLSLHSQMRSEGLTNTGVVIQAYLYRSAKDVRKVVEKGGKVRLCKGAYKESPDVAFPVKKDVDANYDRLAVLLIDGALSAGAPILSQDGRTPPVVAIASHDPARLAHAREYAQGKGMAPSAIEFQMLYGIRRDLQEQCLQLGYPVRVYVPYGTEWYPYFVRRLAERPANLWFFVSNFFRK